MAGQERHLQDQTCANLADKIRELEEAKLRVEEEKRKSMLWCIERMEEMEKEIREKDAIIEEQSDEIRKLKEELAASHHRTNKLQQVLLNSKKFLVERAQSLSDSIGQGYEKIQKELRNDDNEWKFLEKMKEFTSTIKNEIGSAISELRGSRDEARNSPGDDSEEDIKQAERESMETYQKQQELLEKEDHELELALALSMVETRSNSSSCMGDEHSQ
jgi:cellobiose-specific phosphotransferase system component IIA